MPECLQVGGVPVIQDYESYSDMASFQERLDYHYILNTNVDAGLYYIGVYNNDAYFKVSEFNSLNESGYPLLLADERVLGSHTRHVPDTVS